MEQLSQQQRRRGLIKSLLQLKDVNRTEEETQKQYIGASQKQIENVMLEAQIKQFNCQQIQSQSSIKLYETILCRYNPYKKAQFLCCSKYCDNHAIMCGQQACKCALDHIKCNFISIEYFCDQIATKKQQPIPKQIELYFQVKSVIYQHMTNRISQERQALMDWQKDIHNDSGLFLHVCNLNQAIVCNAPKVAYQKMHCNHQKYCVPLQIRKKQINEDKEENIKTICKNIHKKYCSMIEYLNEKVDQLQYHKKYANVNPAEFIFVDFLKNLNICIQNSKELDQDEVLEEMKIVPGRVIHLARQYNKKQFKNLDLEKLSINTIRRIWKGYSEKILRSFVEGKAINELFFQMQKLRQLNNHSLQNLRFQIDKIIQSISQPQEYLFSKSILNKKLEFKNLSKEQLCNKLKEYKTKEVQISNKRQRLKNYKDTKFYQICISNDRLVTAFNDIEIIKELSNFRNVTKLEIKWCKIMKATVSMEILNTMPHLKTLALLNYCQKLCYNFMRKLCQLKQLTFFNINYCSHSQYYRSYIEDSYFIDLHSLTQYNLPQIKDLSKLPKLQNIQIRQLNDVNITQVIKKIKSLRHLTLGYTQWNSDKVNASLIKQLCERRALITLSLIGIHAQSKQVDQIVTNNLFLKTIIIRNIDDNQNINNGTIECMANLIQLQNLCIIGNKAITGKHLSKLDKLIMLQISYCPNICKKEMKKALKNMHKLQHISISGNKQFDDEVLACVESCKKLALLNIQDISVSCEGLKYLEGLTLLNILICGLNNINGKNLIELTKQTAGITRLSIMNLDVNDNELLQISANCQALTHLDIRNTKNITAETLLRIKQLKVVNSYFSQDSKQKLREAGIQAY